MKQTFTTDNTNQKAFFRKKDQEMGSFSHSEDLDLTQVIPGRLQFISELNGI